MIRKCIFCKISLSAGLQLWKQWDIFADHWVNMMLHWTQNIFVEIAKYFLILFCECNGVCVMIYQEEYHVTMDTKCICPNYKMYLRYDFVNAVGCVCWSVRGNMMLQYNEHKANCPYDWIIHWPSLLLFCRKPEIITNVSFHF